MAETIGIVLLYQLPDWASFIILSGVFFATGMLSLKMLRGKSAK